MSEPHPRPNQVPASAEEEARVFAHASAAQRFFFLRPTLAILLTVLLSAGGLMAYAALVKESLPDLAIPQATVMTAWPGADPGSVEQEVTTPLEKQIKTLKGLKSLTSASFDSFSLIAVEFAAGVELTDAMQRLRVKIDDAQSDLPREAEAPSVTRVSVDDRPVMSIALHGDVDARTLSRVAEDVQDALERVQGVNEVLLGGLREEVVQVRLLPHRMLALGLSPLAVRDAVAAANADTPLGAIENPAIGGTVRLTGRFRDVEDLQRLPVARIGGLGGGRPVRLDEVAEVRRDLETERTRAFFSAAGEPFTPAIEVSVKKVPGSDTLAVIEAVKTQLATLEAGPGWPTALRFDITQDEGKQIWKSLTGVLNNGWQAMLAVFAILLLLLTWREGLIAAVCVALTFLGTLVVLLVTGETLNELVIIGMVLALGLLVDVFILMMEGLHEGVYVERHSFSRAALDTVKKYAVPAAAGTATTVLALAPLLFVGGVAGSFIRVLPATAIIALLTALFVALLVAVPMARCLLGPVAARGVGEGKSTRVDRLTARSAEALRAWSLRATLRGRRSAAAWVGGAAAVFVLSLLAFSTVPAVMYPKSDGLKLGINLELPAGTQLETTQRASDLLAAKLSGRPEFASVVQLVGKKSPFTQVGLADALQPSEGEGFAGFSIVFVPRADRAADGHEIADRLREQLAPILAEQVAGATLTVVAETGQPSNAAPVEVNLTGADPTRLAEASERVQAALAAIPGVVDVRDNVGAVQSQIRLSPRREAADFFGLTAEQIGAQARFALGESQIGRFVAGGQRDDLEIRMSTAWPSQLGGTGGPARLEELAMIRAVAPAAASFGQSAGTVPLLSLVQPTLDTAPVSITHRGGRRAITVSAKLDAGSPGLTPTGVVAALTPELERIRAELPGAFDYAFGGEAQETAETFASAGIALVVAVLLVFGVLVLLFGSFLQSLIVILTMPLALIGTFLGFWAFGLSFSFFAMVGLISLIGIVVNDTIVMVDTMNTHLRNGLAVAEAAARGASDRLRPILSTSLTTIVGLIPLAISNPMWRPLCWAIIFGLAVSTLTALVVVPCLYLLFTRERAAGAAA